MVGKMTWSKKRKEKKAARKLKKDAKKAFQIYEREDRFTITEIKYDERSLTFIKEAATDLKAEEIEAEHKEQLIKNAEAWATKLYNEYRKVMIFMRYQKKIAKLTIDYEFEAMHGDPNKARELQQHVMEYQKVIGRTFIFTEEEFRELEDGARTLEVLSNKIAELNKKIEPRVIGQLRNVAECLKEVVDKSGTIEKKFWKTEKDQIQIMLKNLIQTETRENVKNALIQSKQTIEELEKNINQLTSKKQEMENSLSNQKRSEEINQTINKYRNRLQEAKAVNSIGTAKTYAFMITKQKRKLNMMGKIQNAIQKLSSKTTVLTHLKEDLTETAFELPKEADLMGSMNIINTAMGEVHNVDAIMGEITTIEDELKGLAIETDLAAQESAVDIESLPADVRAEIERELRE
ncbi:MAG: hypothetical protein KAU14_04160 [Thermoplasmata archaeon]|nr:hypothetical protein [Thermoplasmata archaeon]